MPYNPTWIELFMNKLNPKYHHDNEGIDKPLQPINDTSTNGSKNLNYFYNSSKLPISYVIFTKYH